jgi:hypothetical protein
MNLVNMHLISLRDILIREGAEAGGDAVGWCTALQAEMSRVRLEFFIDTILLAVLWLELPLGANRNEYQEYFRVE